MAAEWLHRHGQLPADHIEEDVLLAGGMVALGRLAASAPELVIEALTGYRTRDPHPFVQLIGELSAPHAVDLLEAIGSQAPTRRSPRRLASSSSRTRSRLAQQESRPTRS